MSAHDLSRCVAAKLVSADKWSSLEPGDCITVVSAKRPGVVVGLVHACAGCGEHVGLDFEREREGHPQWSVVSGNPAQPETLTTSPSILHDPAKGGCGWHGYLRAGVFEPC